MPAWLPWVFICFTNLQHLLSHGLQVLTEESLKRCIPTQKARYSKRACRRHNACKSCTHVEESNPSMMHDQFRPLRFTLAESAKAQPSWIDFNQPLTKTMWLPPGPARWGLIITYSDPGGLWCGREPSGASGFMCPQWNPSNYRCKRSRTPHQNYFGSLTQFFFPLFFFFLLRQ